MCIYLVVTTTKKEIMNIFNILSEIEKVDGEVFERLNHVSRRGMFSSMGKKISAVAVPTLVAGMLNKAYATTPGALDVLNFTLTPIQSLTRKS